MSQTLEQIEEELLLYKNSNHDWMTDVAKGQIVTSYNKRIASFTGYGAVANMLKQLAYFEKRLQYVIETLEGQPVTRKDGSEASVDEFRRFFAFSNFPAEAWLTKNANTEFRNSACDLIRAHHASMKIQKEGRLVEHDVHRKSSIELLEQIMNLYFAGEHVELIENRSYSCKVINRNYESIMYNGTTSAVVKSTKYDIGILCWGLRNSNIDLQSKAEIAQAGAEMSGELDAMFDKFSIRPRRYVSVLTNGIAFVFVNATFVNGMYSWRHSPVVTNVRSIAALIEGCFSTAVEVLQLLTSFSSILTIKRPLLNDKKDDVACDYSNIKSDGVGVMSAEFPRSASLIGSMTAGSTVTRAKSTTCDVKIAKTDRVSKNSTGKHKGTVVHRWII